MELWSFKICNIKVAVPEGISLNDKDYLNSLSSILKEMGKNYVLAMNEASSEKLYQLHKEVFLKIEGMQREVYELMFRKGWYCLEKVEDTKIADKHQMLDKEYTSIDE